jgi:hypothetical protein
MIFIFTFFLTLKYYVIKEKFTYYKARASWFGVGFSYLLCSHFLSSLIHESAILSSYGQAFSGGMPGSAEIAAF